MKDKDQKPSEKQDGEPDFEKLYYQAMKENVLYRDRKVSVEFTTEEINLLRTVMFEELYEVMQGSYYMNEPDQGEDDENKILNKKADSEELLRKIRSEHKEIVEAIIMKLRFEI